MIDYLNIGLLFGIWDLMIGHSYDSVDFFNFSVDGGAGNNE